jgi:hypothetical protein
MNRQISGLHRKAPLLFSADLEKRFHATKRHAETTFSGLPRGCWGSANGWLLLLGPSPGRADRNQQTWRGGLSRPFDSGVSISSDSGRIEFKGNPARNRRWNLLTSTITSSEKKAFALTTIANLDWGHNPDAGAISLKTLEAGCPIVWDFAATTKPRVVVVLHWKTWEVFSNFLLAKKSGESLLGNFGIQPAPIRIRIVGCDFESLVIKSPQHPSRHFFQKKHAAYLHRQTRKWLMKDSA